ncbi:hypothetical protein [Rhizobium sp. PP-F2F-G48]|uniref:hypothetical protein n=1 Tax=Rhizobium sp. PP-F2F-G48 TaxID=2135651 RepID=UPI00105132A9|nr:hypothetical protein [Rhizobium sp. PP-F2F-G48]
MRVISFLAAAGFLALPVSALVDWLRQDPPPMIRQLGCEIAAFPDGSSEQPPPLDPTQPVTIGVNERLICGVEQEGGDFLVWRGGGNGYGMRDGPVHSDQEAGWQEKLRALIQPPSKAQITACKAPGKPVVENGRVPPCRHVISFAVPGIYELMVRAYGRGNPHVEELTLPIRVIEMQSVLRFRAIAIVPPRGLREVVRTGTVSETLSAPSNPFASPRRETRRISVIQALPGETIVDGSAQPVIGSSNGANMSFEYSPTAVIAVVDLQSGPGFDQRRAWLSAEVSATLRSEVNVPPIALESKILRAPGRQLIYQQPVPEGSLIEFQAASGESGKLALGAWGELGSQGNRIRFVSTVDGLVAETSTQ